MHFGVKGAVTKSSTGQAIRTAMRRGESVRTVFIVSFQTGLAAPEGETDLGPYVRRSLPTGRKGSVQFAQTSWGAKFNVQMEFL